MATKKQRRLDFERSQNIALLSILTKNPPSVPPRTCLSQIQNGDKGARVLSFSRESHLAEALAFIAGISDNSDHVTALCLEELPSGNGLRVVVAVNRGNHANPSDNRVLARVKSGLEAVFHLVARASKKHDPALEEQILDAIIDLCRDRIFSRIKSRRKDVAYSKKGKESARSRLQRIISAARKHTFQPGARPSDVGSFIRQTERLQDALIEVETINWASVNRSLKRLTVMACSLHRGRMAVNMEGIFGDLQTSEDLTPNDGPTFQRLVKKLARYRECAAYLFRRAKDNKLFRNIVVMPVSLRQEYFIRAEEVLGDHCLTNCVARCRNEAGNDTFKARSRVTALKELGGQGFFPALKKILKEGRIHAEIQIVAHYELHPAAIPPRVIKSSKDACYLCHEFLKAHRKFYTSRTHGRLYPAWKLPSMVVFNGVQTQMNRVLQAQIWLESAEYAETGVAKEAVQVNESEVGSLSPISSLASFGLLAESAGTSKPNHVTKVGVGGFGETVSVNSPTLNVPLVEENTRELAGVHDEKPLIPQLAKEGKHADEIPGTEAEVDSSSQRHPARRPLPLTQILDDKLSGEETPSHKQPPVAEEIQSTPGAIPTDRDVQLETSESSMSSSEDQGQSQDASTPEEAGDDQIATEQTSPEPEPEQDIELEPERNPGLASKAHEPAHKPRAEPESKYPDQVLEPPAPSTPLSPPEKTSPILPKGSFSHDDANQDLAYSSPESASMPGTSQQNLPSHTGPNRRLEQVPTQGTEDHQDNEDVDDTEIILTQGQPSTVILTGKRHEHIPIYRNGRAGKLVVHPEYITTRAPRSNKTSSGTIELRVTWLSPAPSISPLPSSSSSLSSLASNSSSSSSSSTQTSRRNEVVSEQDQGQKRGRNQDPQQQQKGGHEDDKAKAKAKVNNPEVTGMGIPEFLVESLPMLEYLDTGTADCVRLVDRCGEVVLVEVIRT